jgi:hypothetical protein
MRLGRTTRLCRSSPERVQTKSRKMSASRRGRGKVMPRRALVAPSGVSLNSPLAGTPGALRPAPFGRRCPPCRVRWEVDGGVRSSERTALCVVRFHLFVQGLFDAHYSAISQFETHVGQSTTFSITTRNVAKRFVIRRRLTFFAPPCTPAMETAVGNHCCGPLVESTSLEIPTPRHLHENRNSEDRPLYGGAPDIPE